MKNQVIFVEKISLPQLKQLQALGYTVIIGKKKSGK